MNLLKQMNNLNDTTKKGLICLFFVVFALLGILTADDYGRAWDEPLEMEILKSNIVSYEQYFGVRSEHFEGVEPIQDSIEKDHGVSSFYIFAPALYNESLSEEQLSQMWHMLCWCIFTLGAIGLYGCLRQLSTPRHFALIGVVFLLITPRFFAEAHYNNKDIVLFSFTLLMLWQAFKLLKKPTYKALTFFAIFGAFAFNTKIVGLALFGLCGIFVCVHSFVMAKERNMKISRILLMLLYGVGLFFAFTILLTPAAWSNPLEYMEYLVENAVLFSRWNGYVLYLGEVYWLLKASIPQSYLPVMIFATTPMWMFALIGIGQCIALCSIGKRIKRIFNSTTEMQLTLTTLLWLVPLVFAVLSNTKVYNGWRHFYFIYAPMCVFAGYAIYQISLLLSNKIVMRKVLACIVTLCFVGSGIGLFRWHPYQYTYYQPIARYMNADGDFFELDYWNVSVRDALVQLASKIEGNISIAGADLWADVGLKFALEVLPEEVASRFEYLALEDSEQAEYILNNPSYENYNKSTIQQGNLQEVVCISAYNQPIMQILKQ